MPVLADNLVDLHGRCGRRFATLVAGVGPGQWQDGTPCSEWDVRALVHHLLYEQLWVPLLLGGLTVEQVGSRFDGDLLSGDAVAWPGLLAAAIGQAHAAVAQPGALARAVHLSFGDVPGQEYVLELTADLAIHGWDLAQATGQDAALDPAVVAVLLAWAEANAGMLAGSGMFGSPVDAGPSAPDDIRVLGLLGRA